MLTWDNPQDHVSAAMRRLIAARPWLRVYPLPVNAPELNPVEKVRCHLKRGLANLAAGTATNLAKPGSRRCHTPTASSPASSKPPACHPHDTLIIQDL